MPVISNLLDCVAVKEFEAEQPGAAEESLTRD